MNFGRGLAFAFPTRRLNDMTSAWRKRTARGFDVVPRRELHAVLPRQAHPSERLLAKGMAAPSEPRCGAQPPAFICGPRSNSPSSSQVTPTSSAHCAAAAKYDKAYERIARFIGDTDKRRYDARTDRSSATSSARRAVFGALRSPPHRRRIGMGRHRRHRSAHAANRERAVGLSA